MVIETIDYTVAIDHDGRKYFVSIPNLSVPKCSNCGSISIDDEADSQIEAAFRQEAKLLTPRAIRAGREAEGLTQQAFADLLGVAASTLSRWETGAQVQQRVMNDYLQAFFELPALRQYLGRLRHVRNSAREGINGDCKAKQDP